jgi:hypothetical protein
VAAAVQPIKSRTIRRPALYAFFAAIIFFVIALLPPDLLGGAIAYLREGRYTFVFRSLRATTVAAMFAFIIATRSLLVWGYARWAKRRQVFSVRMSFGRVDAAWCLAAATLAIAVNTILAHVSGEPHRFAWVAFIRYWGTWRGIGNAILQYAYYVTEGFAIVWIVDAFQNSGEFAFPRLWFPWGALGLMATWGLGHYFSKDFRTAIYAVFIACVIGVLHITSRKSAWPSLVFWSLMTGG